jgi:tRNA-modifying protein YgfZ|tara:strand:- start:1188 stop:2174 length:987 start_codon:yes stop_codon:yes gene_type:complete
MNNWYSFLQLQASASLGCHSISFGETSFDYTVNPKKCSYFSPLIHLGAILVEGKDAKKFLQGQVTCDLNQLSQDNSILGARCNPKGRTLVNFQLHELNDQKLLMIMHHSLVVSVKDELSKYAAFFKVCLVDASDAYIYFGLSSNYAVMQDKVSFSSSIFHYNDGRILTVCSLECAERQWLELQRSGVPVGTERWRLLDIQSGFAFLQEETSGIFIPQMLNLDYLNAISFKKGCYTGQEIVARMKYLGTLKRRMYRVAITDTEAPFPGTPCFLPDTEQSVGNVVSAAYAGSNNYQLLLVLTDAAADKKSLMLGSNNIKEIEYLSLPYIK